ncbi:hypothetical protein KDH_79930 [Dictyobacter sp. S3.2.2.5]|uniref:Transmembrane protein n=2 Tax=Dictyobacter halimunensis TaxID=3026934 RepID=A0ABQ6G3T7_9CHLR|nr:hypothetical protein KDH_79930 [Dictyobacter sp. S3.2.2.5]
MWAPLNSIWQQAHVILSDPAIQSICAIIALIVPLSTFTYNKIRRTRLYRACIEIISFILYLLFLILLPLLWLELLYLVGEKQFLPLDQVWFILRWSIIGMPLFCVVVVGVNFLLPRLRVAYTQSAIGQKLQQPGHFWRFRISLLEVGVIRGMLLIDALSSLYTAISFFSFN